MDLGNIMHVSAAGMQAQSLRIKVISENVANAQSTGETPGDLPYRRKTVTFQNVMDRELGMDTVRVSKIGVDESDFRRKYDPGHPSADPEGYVLMPNVNALVETVDLREAQRSYEANLRVVLTVRQMLQQTVAMMQT